MLPKKRLERGIAEFRRWFGDQPTQALGVILPAEEICKVLEEEVSAYRERVYPPMTTLGLLIGQVLSSDGACQDAVARRLSERTAAGQTPCSLNSGPYCKARQRLPLGLIKRLGISVADKLESDCPQTWKWRGRSIKLMDGTILSMPDTEQNQSSYPQSGVQKPGLGFPLAMLVALISLSTGAVLQWALGPCRGKHIGARTMTAHLLGAVSRLRLPIRPGRVEPRAVKRRPKNLPLLTQPRHAARVAIMQSRLRTT